jgi:large subunit ribosomal protein L24
MVITGANKGKKGSIVKSLPKTSQVIVEGVNLKKKHQKAKTTDGVGKVIEVAKPIHVSNVKLVK